MNGFLLDKNYLFGDSRHLTSRTQKLTNITWLLSVSLLGLRWRSYEENAYDTPILNGGLLQRESARELAELAYSTDLLEASIGVAAINSSLDADKSIAWEMNASEVLISRGRGKNVALIGRFHFIQQLRQSAGQLWVIEQHHAVDEYPAEAAVELVPSRYCRDHWQQPDQSHIVALCSPKAGVMVLGPSMPLSPILLDHGVNIISGTYVVDEATVLQTVERNASFHQVEGVNLLTFVREKNEK